MNIWDENWTEQGGGGKNIRVRSFMDVQSYKKF